MHIARFFTSFLLCTFLVARVSAFQPDIIIDAHSDASSVELAGSGAWSDETATAETFRGNAKVIQGTTASASQFARFHTTLPQTGLYQVFVWSYGRTGFGDAVNVKVTHADTDPTTAVLNQSANSGQWFLAGTFWFENAKEAEVKIEHNDSGRLYADAVRFSLLEPALEIDTAAPGVGVMTYAPSGAWLNQVSLPGAAKPQD